MPHQHEDENYIDICSNEMDNSIKKFISRFVIMFSIFAIAITKIYYVTIFMGIKTTTTEVKIPFIEEKSNDDFLANIILQTILSSYGLFGFIAMEVGMELNALVVAISSKLIKFEFNKLDEWIERAKLSPMQLCTSLRNIVQQVMDVDK